MSDDGLLRNIMAQHCLLTDQRRCDDFAERFTDDGRLIMHGRVMAAGREAIRNWSAAHQMPPGRHMISNIVIRLNGDDAEGEGSVMFIAEPENKIAAIREYAAHFTRQANGWKILEWKVASSIGELSQTPID